MYITADCVQYEMKSQKGTCGFFYSQHTRKYCKCRMYLHDMRSYKIKWETYAVDDTDICSRWYRHRNNISGKRENIPHRTITHTGGNVMGWWWITLCYLVAAN